MAVRNFWLSAVIDGKAAVLKGGPRSKDGGMDIALLVRREGQPVDALEILCRALANGKLAITVRDADGNKVHYKEYER